MPDRYTCYRFQESTHPQRSPIRSNSIKAADYLERIESTALVRRFGWVMDHIKADIPPEIRERLLVLAAHGPRTWLGANPLRKVPDAIGYDKTWRLFVNVTPEELHGSAGLGRRKTVKKDS
jgi:predicted transcriptional regulator of viral defense system